MHEHESPADGSDATGDAEPDRIVIAVVRSGGIAGLRRRWRAEPAPEVTPQWVALVERCPWDERIDDATTGADRYVWSIHARLHSQQLEQVVPDTQLEGAWRELVDAVRDADSADARASDSSASDGGASDDGASGDDAVTDPRPDSTREA